MSRTENTRWVETTSEARPGVSGRNLRYVLAFGTLGLFTYAMVDPQAFAYRMVGLNAVPEPLWWLLGAIVAFYFGARETYYFRNRGVVSPFAAGGTGAAAPDENAALEEWRRG